MRLKINASNLIVLLISLFFLESEVSRAQIFSEIPIDFDQINQAQVLRNPAYVNQTSRLQFSNGYKGFNSLSSNIRTYYADVTGRPLHEKDLFIGLQIYQDREGKLISHDRFYLKSNYTVPVAEDYQLGFGLALGFINYQIKNNVATSGFTDKTMDVKGGLHFYSNRLDLQVSFLQLLDQDIMLITNQIELTRYYQAFGSYHFPVSSSITLTPSLFWRTAVNKESDLRFRGRVSFYDKFYTAGTFHYENGYIIEAGINKMEVNGISLAIGTSFRRWVNNASQINANIMELTLGIGLVDNERVTYSSQSVLNK